MIIDFHTHVMPPEMAADPIWLGKCPMTIENVLEAAKAGGVDRTVISKPGHELRHMDASQRLKTIRTINQYLASLARKHDNIYALATSVPYGGEPFLKELERAVKEDGAKGTIILSSLPGHYPDDDEALPFSNSSLRSTFRCSCIRPRSASARSGSIYIAWLRASAGRWTVRLRSRA